MNCDIWKPGRPYTAIFAALRVEYSACCIISKCSTTVSYAKTRSHTLLVLKILIGNKEYSLYKRPIKTLICSQMNVPLLKSTLKFTCDTFL